MSRFLAADWVCVADPQFLVKCDESELKEKKKEAKARFSCETIRRSNIRPV
jgi:hypothetical protein